MRSLNKLSTSWNFKCPNKKKECSICGDRKAISKQKILLIKSKRNEKRSQINILTLVTFLGELLWTCVKKTIFNAFVDLFFYLFHQDLFLVFRNKAPSVGYLHQQHTNDLILPACDVKQQPTYASLLLWKFREPYLFFFGHYLSNKN